MAWPPAQRWNAWSVGQLVAGRDRRRTNRHHVDQRVDRHRSATPTITKTASVPATYQGGPVTYSLAVVLPADSGPYYDLSVMDELPDGIDFVETVSAACTGCATASDGDQLVLINDR